jgi:transposase
VAADRRTEAERGERTPGGASGKHFDHLLTFLTRPGLDATNWRAEQALRPAAVNRKVWGGNRTWPGAEAQAILASLVVTLAQRNHAALNWFTQARRTPTPLALPAWGR